MADQLVRTGSQALEPGVTLTSSGHEVNAFCSKCEMLYYSAGGRSELCPKCRPASAPGSSPVAAAAVPEGLARTASVALEPGVVRTTSGHDVNAFCSSCETLYYSAGGKSILCPKCRPPAVSGSTREPTGGAFPPTGGAFAPDASGVDAEAARGLTDGWISFDGSDVDVNGLALHEILLPDLREMMGAGISGLEVLPNGNLVLEFADVPGTVVTAACERIQVDGDRASLRVQVVGIESSDPDLVAQVRKAMGPLSRLIGKKLKIPSLLVPTALGMARDRGVFSESEVTISGRSLIIPVPVDQLWFMPYVLQPCQTPFEMQMKISQEGVRFSLPPDQRFAPDYAQLATWFASRLQG